jgi:hypothetical protein
MMKNSAAGNDGDHFYRIPRNNRNTGKIPGQECGTVVFHHHWISLHIQEFQKPYDGTGFRQKIGDAVQDNAVLGGHCVHTIAQRAGKARNIPCEWRKKFLFKE